jgi:hypothetical protein
MSVSKIALFLKVALPSAEIKSRVENASGLKYEQMQDLSNFLQGLKAGSESAVAILEIGDGSGGALSASGQVTIAGSGAQSVTINGGALTGGTDYVIANLSVSEIAANIVEAITNSQLSRVQSVYASSSAGVVSLFAKSAGTVGNLVTTTATGAAAAGAATLASGAEGTQRVLKFNLNS